jgi:hypothetical protein
MKLKDVKMKGMENIQVIAIPGNTEGGCITVPLTSCLTGLD